MSDDPTPAEHLSRQDFLARVMEIAAAHNITLPPGGPANFDAVYANYLSLSAAAAAKTPVDMPPLSIAGRACPICGFQPLTFKPGCCGDPRSRWVCFRCHYEEAL
jgi:hypothetical protein